LGGVGFSVMPELTLAYCGVDTGIKGEGEWSLVELAEKLRTGRDFRDIPGLIFKEKEKYRRNPIHYGPLQNLCLSRREALNHLRYFREGGMVGFETKRGCNQKCTYCADPLSKGRVIRFRNPKDVASELAHLYEKGIDHFHTCDSEFNIHEQKAIEVCKEIVNKNLGGKIRWYAYASPTPFSEELADWMRRAGCVGIDFGADHGNDSMLKCLGRSHKAEDLRRTGEISRKYGFSFMYDLLLGGPGETRKTIQGTIELMKKISPDRVGISLGVRLYRGTTLAREVIRQEGFSEQNRNLHGVIRGNESMLQPIFYLPSGLGEDVEDFVDKQTAGDPRFLMGSRKNMVRNYNYNENSRLMEAIKQGYRGAFWDILRRVEN
ncbi:MAG: radical SAM protein, partial [Deltaproteobacteria bacterium]|nr:radical SAM protein [Deltaproteobacteria bacterium]